MKNFILLLATCGALSQAYAAEAPVDGEATAVLEQPSMFHMRVGASSYLERYREYEDQTKLMQEEASMVGLQLEGRFQLASGNQVVLSGFLAGGDSTYTGAYWGGAYGDLKVSGLTRTVLDFNAVYKWQAPARLNGLVFGGGLGYRTLDDRLDKAGEGGYRRKNQRIYGIFSVERPIELSDTWQVTPSFAYQQVLRGTQHSEIGEGITHDQNSGNGFVLSVPFVRKTDRGSAVISPFWREWNISGTNPTQDTYEPANKTSEIGVTFGWEY